MTKTNCFYEEVWNTTRPEQAKAFLRLDIKNFDKLLYSARGNFHPSSAYTKNKTLYWLSLNIGNAKGVDYVRH